MGKSTISMAIFNSYVSLPESNKASAILQELDKIGCSRPYSVGRLLLGLMNQVILFLNLGLNLGSLIIW